MLLRTSLSLFCLLVATYMSYATAERVRYDDYPFYKVKASNISELSLLKKLEGSSDSVIFLDDVYYLNRDMRVVVAPHKMADFIEVLNSNEIKYELIDKDFQRILEAGEKEETTTDDDDDEYNWRTYYTLNQNYIWLRDLPEEYPKVVTLIEAGKTYERRSILGVKISYPGKANKPGIFLEAGIHSREWIGPATATYIINQLLTSEDESVKQIAQNYDWYIFPHANPDGYVYTHTTNRLWRKTRSPQGACYGVDPNRNFDFHWDEVGTSSEPCAETFSGPKAFSEIETRTLAKYVASLKDKIQLYIAFHSYSQLLLHPYGYQSELPPNGAHLTQVFDATVAAISKRYGTIYGGGNIYDGIYPAAGSSIDWAYGQADVKMTFLFELRPDAQSSSIGFQLPASQILPTGEETLDAVVAMVNEVDKLGYFDV